MTDETAPFNQPVHSQGNSPPAGAALDAGQLLGALRALKRGDFTARLPMSHSGVAGDIALAFNDLAELLSESTDELQFVSTAVGKEGNIVQRLPSSHVAGSWGVRARSVNTLIDDLAEPTVEVG